MKCLLRLDATACRTEGTRKRECLLTSDAEEESEEESSDESVDVPVAPVAVRRKFGDEEDSDDVSTLEQPSQSLSDMF
jgi:hypothetical protein